ncbi:MAG TPA: energy transducer TonB [Terriglobales bacterium]|jgi:protein TonB|nr:energy transducer TonB [Terriglobales bacterium]
MFSTLESTWDESSRRRGWSTLASFTMQALALSLLLAVSLLWVGGPPQVRWLQLTAPASFTPVGDEQPVRGGHTSAPVRNFRLDQIIAPPSIPTHIVNNGDDNSVPAAPDFSSIDTGDIRSGHGGADVAHGIGDMPVVIPPRPVAAKPLMVSHLAEANLLHKVQPIYPPIARQARVQGAVELRAIISKTGTIENLIVVRGHPMLSSAAIEAVRQWRYRPYLLNGEPIEVETEITVNFLLSGG